MSSPIVPSADDVGAGGGGTTGELELRRRLLNADGPIEEDEAARQKMKNAKVFREFNISRHDKTPPSGFDPDNASDSKSLGFTYLNCPISPMSYFAREGDLPMMRWLYTKGADTAADTREVDLDAHYWFPMYAASYSGQLDACKWLHAHGAAKDVQRTFINNTSSTLRQAFRTPGRRELSRWMILQGALSKDEEPSVLDINKMFQCISDNGDPEETENVLLLDWAREMHQTRISFLQFLNGTISPPEYSVSNLHRELAKRTRCESAADTVMSSMSPEQQRLLWEKLFPEIVQSPLKIFAGKHEIIRTVGDFAGVVHGQQAGIIRQLTERLPDFNFLSFKFNSHRRLDDIDESDIDEDYLSDDIEGDY